MIPPNQAKVAVVKTKAIAMSRIGNWTAVIASSLAIVGWLGKWFSSPQEASSISRTLRASVAGV